MGSVCVCVCVCFWMDYSITIVGERDDVKTRPDNPGSSAGPVLPPTDRLTSTHVVSRVVNPLGCGGDAFSVVVHLETGGYGGVEGGRREGMMTRGWKLTCI